MASMGKYVSIRKVKQLENKHLYEILPYDESKTFYMIIDPEEKKFFYYLDMELIKHVVTIDVSKEKDSPFVCPEIHRGSAMLASVQANRAMKKNEFPEALDYCA